MKGNARADKHGRAAHDFGIGMNDALQIFDCHNMPKIRLPAKLSPANMTVGRAPAILRREPRWVPFTTATCSGLLQIVCNFLLVRT